MFKSTTFLLLAGLGGFQSVAQTIERIKLTDNDLSCQQIYAETLQIDDVIKLVGPGHPQALTPIVATAPIQPATPLSPVQQAVLNHPNNANLTPEQKATLIAQTGLAERRGNAAVGAMYAGAPSAAAIHGAVASDTGVQAAIARAPASGMSEARINATIGAGMQRSGLPAAPVSAGQGYMQPGGLASVFGALAGMGAKPAAAAPPIAAATASMPVASNSLGAQAKARKDYLTGFFLARGCKLSEIQK